MSSESLEEGEIPSEAEPTPEPSSPAELNDESVIDEIVKNENSTAQRILSPEQPRRRNNRTERRRNIQQQQRRSNDSLFSPPFEQQHQIMGTSWHANGNGSGCNGINGGRAMRQPPPESLIFGMPATTPPLQKPNQDIRLLQNLVNSSYEYYPPPGINRAPLHFFAAPPPPLMSLPLPPLMMRAPSSQQNLQPISPTPLPASFDDNYEQVSMDMVSPDEPQTNNDQFMKPPVEIPLEAVVDAPKSAPKPVLEDEEALRAMLLSQLSQKKKRNAEKPTTQKSPPKRLRKNSTKISSSVEDVFGTKAPIPPPPPVPKIQVNLSTKTVEEPAAVAVLNPEIQESPASPSPSPVRVSPEPYTRAVRKAELELRMSEISKDFEEQRAKVANASKDAKTAAVMAKRATEMAKEAEEMNRKALEMREKCIEDSRLGKEEMKKILIEKRDIQNAIDLISIEDMDDIDVEDFPEIIVSEVKREPARADSDYRSPKHEPALTTETSLINENTAESSYREAETPQELMQNGVSKEKEDEEKVDKEIEEEAEEETLNETDDSTQDKDDDEESVEGEDEYEEVEEEEEMSDPFSPEKTTVALTEKIFENTENDTNNEQNEPTRNDKVPTKSTAMDREAALRQRLMNKMTRPEKTPEDSAPVVSSSVQDHAAECRNMLLSMCKFELNGKCERPRDCSFLHLHSLNDRKQQMQLLEGLFREIFEYNEEDIEGAVQQTLHFMPEFSEFEKLMEKFASVVYQNSPDYKNKLFTFFASRR